MKFSDAIIQIRHKCYLTQSDFAEKIGVSFSTVNRWENGKNVPNMKTIKKLDAFCKENEININLSDCVWGN